MNQSVFVLTVTLSCVLFIFNDSAVISPVEIDINNETQLFNTSHYDLAHDFIFPDDPILANISSELPDILASLNFTGNDTFDEDDKIGGNTIITILG